MEPLKIGILGQLRAGKDTVADIIKKEGSGSWWTFAFSDGIHSVIEDYIPKEYDKGKPRLALQEIGQLLRKFDTDVWVNKLLNSNDYKTGNTLGANILVTDVRQPNEVKRLKENGFIILKVSADKDVRAARAVASGDNFDSNMLNHETEQLVSICPFDYEINNSGTLEELESSVKDFLHVVDLNLLLWEVSTYEQRQVSQSN